jgi:hypothetical protein
MAELEIRTNGEVLQADLVVGQSTFTRPFIERELAGIWFPDGWDDGEGCGCNTCDEDAISELEEQVDELERNLKAERELVADLRKQIAALEARK